MHEIIRRGAARNRNRTNKLPKLMIVVNLAMKERKRERNRLTVDQTGVVKGENRHHFKNFVTFFSTVPSLQPLHRHFPLVALTLLGKRHSKKCILLRYILRKTAVYCCSCKMFMQVDFDDFSGEAKKLFFGKQRLFQY